MSIERPSVWASVLLLGAVLLCGGAAQAQQQGAGSSDGPVSEHEQEVEHAKDEKYRPTGEVRIEGTSVQIGLGFQWGKGVLSFGGKQHAFSISGLELVGVGVTKVRATGTIFNLDRLEDFEGTYAAVGAGGAVGAESAGGITMRKGNVYMTLRAEQTGVQLSLGGGGLRVKLERPE